MKTLSGRETTEREASGWLLLAATLLLAALATPFFLQRVYVADDLGEFHLPVRDFYARQLERGEPFDWMPSLYGGFYVAGEGQLGAYHPWHWVLYRTLPLGAAFNLELLANYPFLFVGTYLFLRRLIDRRDAALLGALAFTYSGFSLLHFIHPNAMAVVAHLPWLLWAIDVALDDTGRRDRAIAVIAIGVLTASQLLLGYPQYVWFSLLAEAAFVAYLLIVRSPPVAAVAPVGLAVVAGGLIGAIQWIPTWHLLRESVRSTADAEFANVGSLHPLNLVQLVAPYLFEHRVVGQNTHELGLYVGAVPIVLCIWLLSRRDAWGAYRPLIRGLLIATLLATLLAAGEFGGLYQLQSWLPLVNRFRFPCRAIMLLQLALCLLASVAAALLFARRGATTNERDRDTSHRALWLTILAATALAIIGPLVWSEHVAAPLLVWAGPLLIAVACLLVVSVERGTRGSVALLALFLAVDLGVYGMSYAVVGRTADLHAFVAAIPRPPMLNGHRVAAPDAANKLRTGDRMLLAGLQRIDGYAGLEPAKQLDYADPRVLALAGVAWQLAAPPVDSADNSKIAREWQPIAPTAPRARLVSRTLAPEQLATAAEHSWQAVVCEPPLVVPISAPGTARLLEDRAGRLVLETEAPATQLLVTTESFDPGWVGTVDGQPAPVVRINGDFLGVPVVAGKRDVVLEFRPRARRLGGQLAVAGLGLLTVAAFGAVAVKRRPARLEDPPCDPN